LKVKSPRTVPEEPWAGRVTPGTRRAREEKLRPFKGRSRIWRFWRVAPREGEVVLRPSSGAKTSMVSVRSPGWRRRSTVCSWLRWRVRLVVERRKPGESMVIF
jgi:hypothetical protein